MSAGTAPEIRRMQGKRVLVVEDEVAIRDMLRFALERADFAVAEAEDVQAARLAIADARPDLILLDWMLPGVSGVEFARELRRDELTADLAIIMVTARVDADDRVRGRPRVRVRGRPRVRTTAGADDRVCGRPRADDRARDRARDRAHDASESGPLLLLLLRLLLLLLLPRC